MQLLLLGSPVIGQQKLYKPALVCTQATCSHLNEKSYIAGVGSSLEVCPAWMSSVRISEPVKQQKEIYLKYDIHRQGNCEQATP